MNIFIPQPRFRRRDFLLSLIPIIAASRRRSSYLVSEDFEGTGTPSGWTFNGTGTCDFDNTGSASPAGGEALSCASNTLNNTGGARLLIPGEPLGGLGFYCQVRLGSVATNQNRAVYFLDNSYVYFGTVGTAGQWFFNTVKLDPVIAAGTWYHVWIDIIPGVSRSIYFSTTSTKPGSPNATVWAANTSRVVLNYGNANGARFDKVRVSAFPIGSNPA